jgi:hypothetical protein
MKKNCFWFLPVFVITTMLSINFVSCGGDNDKKNEPEKASIIGTWRHDFSTGYILLVFKKDGTGYIEEYDHGSIQYSNPIKYYYDDVKERYMIVETDGDHTYTYPVQYYNETTLVLVDPDGKSMTYTRVSD